MMDGPLFDSAALALAVGIVAALLGSTLGGVLLGAKALGAELAGFMGALYGLVAGSAGVALGLLATAYIG